MLLAVSVLPYSTQMVGEFYLVSTLLLDAVFLFYAIKLWLSKDDKVAMQTFWYSIVYLGGIFGAMLIDRYLSVWF